MYYHYDCRSKISGIMYNNNYISVPSMYRTDAAKEDYITRVVEEDILPFSTHVRVFIKYNDGTEIDVEF